MPAWPNFASVGTVYSGYPYAETDEWVVSESGLASGASYTFTNNTTVLRRVVVRFPLMYSADKVTLEAFFESVGGTLGNFTFVDDAGVTWNLTRFDSDSLHFNYLQPGAWSVEIPLSMQQN
jgi:hypothetical protein